MSQKKNLSFKPYFGIGTLFAIGAIFVLWWSGAFQPPPKPQTDLKTVYEADSSGTLQKVEPSSDKPAAPLVIKEPSLLLKHAEGLKLTSEQRRKIQRIAQEWEKEKARWLHAIQQEQTHLQQQTQSHENEKVPYNVLQQGLQAYSELSRQYGARRSAAWERATNVLTEKQREQLCTSQMKSLLLHLTPNPSPEKRGDRSEVQPNRSLFVRETPKLLI